VEDEACIRLHRPEAVLPVLATNSTVSRSHEGVSRRRILVPPDFPNVRVLVISDSWPDWLPVAHALGVGSILLWIPESFAAASEFIWREQLEGVTVLQKPPILSSNSPFDVILGSGSPEFTSHLCSQLPGGCSNSGLVCGLRHMQMLEGPVGWGRWPT
jgi:hypothetical protein